MSRNFNKGAPPPEPPRNHPCLEVPLVKALVSLGREDSVDFHENPVLHCMSMVSPVVVVVLPAVTAFHHFKQW